MPVVLQPYRQNRSVLRVSLGISLAMFVVVVAGLVLWGGSAEAQSVCALSSTTGPNPQPWSTAPWVCVPAQAYPGIGVGDTANITFTAPTLSVDIAVPNSVNLQETAFGVNLTIPAGSSL